MLMRNTDYLIKVVDCYSELERSFSSQKYKNRWRDESALMAWHRLLGDLFGVARRATYLFLHDKYVLLFHPESIRLYADTAVHWPVHSHNEKDHHGKHHGR